jgi:hypothetical protein
MGRIALGIHNAHLPKILARILPRQFFQNLFWSFPFGQ